MTYSNTNTFDCGNVGVTLTLAVQTPETGLCFAVPDSRLELGFLFAVRCDLSVASYRYTAAEGTGLYLTVSAPESPKPVVRSRGFRRAAGVRRFVAPPIGRVFALRL